MNEKRVAAVILGERLVGGALVLFGVVELLLRSIPFWASWSVIVVGVCIGLFLRRKLPENVTLRLMAVVLIVPAAFEASTHAMRPAWTPYALMAYGVVMLIYVQYRASRAKRAA